MWGGLQLVLEAHGGGGALPLDGAGGSPLNQAFAKLGSERSEKQLEPGHSTLAAAPGPSCRKSVCTPGLSLKQKIRHTYTSPPAHTLPASPPHTHPGQHQRVSRKGHGVSGESQGLVCEGSSSGGACLVPACPGSSLQV